LPVQEEFLDAVQSAYLSAFRSFQSFRGESSFKTWITRIVMNQCLMCLREPARRQLALSLDQSGPDRAQPITAVDSRTPERLALRAEMYRTMADAAANLQNLLVRFSLVVVFRSSRFEILPKRSASRCRQRKVACFGPDA
jgi:RNA polymerase sigma-70 factor (ECF subfamily)